MAKAIGYALFETAFGTCGIAWSRAGITRLALPEATPAETEARLRRLAPDATGAAEPDDSIAGAIEGLQTYFDGAETDMRAFAVDLAGVPPFHLRLYQAMRNIGWGQTTTYGALGQEIGATGPSGAARAVGQAMGRNPVPVIIPCHRVLASGGKIGGFSAFGGRVTKERLLMLERVSLGRDAPLLDLMQSR